MSDENERSDDGGTDFLLGSGLFSGLESCLGPGEDLRSRAAAGTGHIARALLTLHPGLLDLLERLMRPGANPAEIARELGVTNDMFCIYVLQIHQHLGEAYEKELLE